MVATIFHEVGMSDNKLPDRYNKPATAPSPIDRVHPAVTRASLLGKFVSGFMARLNTHTIQRNTDEVKALRAYRGGEGEAGRRHARTRSQTRALSSHRDDIIGTITSSIVDQMEANPDRARQYGKSASIRRSWRASSEAGTQSGQSRSTTQWGVDAFNQSLPHRQDGSSIYSNPVHSMPKSRCCCATRMWQNLPPRRHRRTASTGALEEQAIARNDMRDHASDDASLSLAREPTKQRRTGLYRYSWRVSEHASGRREPMGC